MKSDHTATLSVPDDVSVGMHRAVVIVEQSDSSRRHRSIEIPVDDLGPWPTNLSLSRADMYGDDGR